MQIYENETTEFKEEWTESAKKTICAFANSYGGTIYFGVRDDGVAIGIPDNKVDRLIRIVADVARYGVVPSADHLVRCLKSESEGKTILEVRVSAGPDMPYAVKIKDEGTRVFVRRGAACYEATDEELRQLYRNSNPVALEQRVSRLQELSFRETEAFFAKQEIAFAESKMQILGLKTQDGLYTNLAYWLSDQCAVETKLGFFAGDSKASSTQELLVYQGSVLKQYEQVLERIVNRFGTSLRVETFASVDLLRSGRRVEVEEYPLVAVREALVNAFAHRDYGIDAPSFVSVHSDRIEIFTYGGLPQPLQVEDLRSGVSFCRNNKLAGLLMRLKLMEGYGMGFPKIYDAYARYGMEPMIDATPRWMKVSLPRVTLEAPDLSDLGQRIMRCLRTNGRMSRAALQKEAAGGSYARVIAELKTLQEKGLIAKVGSGPKVLYQVAGSGEQKSAND